MQGKQSLYPTILNAIPLPIFLVDEDVQIHELNLAATQAFGLERERVLQRRGGDVLHCLNSIDAPEGCGSGSHCADCIIRNSVLSCLTGQSVHRRRMKFMEVNGSKKRELELLVTVAPLPPGSGRALLILEDITELSLLKSIIPICMHCKKVRDDQQYWQQVEGYFHNFIGVEFSHGVCPDCVKEHYPDMRR
ncbi:MAG TPA: PAS domain-containing protein [Terriglobales bacterium]|nr:PAS domain-containing protein [Terriglobales bacterium]